VQVQMDNNKVHREIANKINKVKKNRKNRKKNKITNKGIIIQIGIN